MQPVFERVDWLRGRLPDLREFPGHLIDNQITCSVGRLSPTTGHGTGGVGMLAVRRPEIGRPGALQKFGLLQLGQHLLKRGPARLEGGLIHPKVAPVGCQNSIRIWRAALDPLRDRQGVAGSSPVSRSKR
jgi:hypothetical protein